MNEARRPTTAFSASITIHFFSTSAGFNEAVVFIMVRVPYWLSELTPRLERAHMPTVARAVNSRPAEFRQNIENAEDF